MNNIINSQRGFSLLEVLLVIAIVSGISLVLTQSFITTSRSSTKIEISSSTKQSGDFSMRIIEQYIKQARAIQSACTGVPSSSITITNRDGGSTVFGCSYDVNAAVTRIASSSGSATEYLTPNTVTLGGINCADSGMTLQFICSNTFSNVTSVQIKYSLAQAGTPLDQFQKALIPFQTTVNVR